jgi:Tetracyclin repressor-like, C-terminal domain
MDGTVDALLRHPGIARVGLANVPTAGAALRIREAMLGALLTGGIDPAAAGGAIDTLPLLALATAVESGVYRERGIDLRAEGRRITRAYKALSPDEFPLITAHLDAVLGGKRTDRFRFAVDTFLDGLTADDDGGRRRR